MCSQQCLQQVQVWQVENFQSSERGFPEFLDNTARHGPRCRSCPENLGLCAWTKHFSKKGHQTFLRKRVQQRCISKLGSARINCTFLETLRKSAADRVHLRMLWAVSETLRLTCTTKENLLKAKVQRGHVSQKAKRVFSRTD